MTAAFDLGTARVGDRLPDLVRGPITRATLALFAGASNDHVPLHIDSDYAKEAGMDDVFGHGMLSMAYMGQMLLQCAAHNQLLSWNIRFLAITPLHATVTCNGEILEHLEAAGRPAVRVGLTAYTDAGLETLKGEALLALD